MCNTLPVLAPHIVPTPDKESYRPILYDFFYPTVMKAVQYRLEEQSSIQEKIISLKIDLNNVISHAFGEHNKCTKIGYFCDGLQKENEENYIPQLKCGLYEKLQNILKYISWNANRI